MSRRLRNIKRPASYLDDSDSSDGLDDFKGLFTVVASHKATTKKTTSNKRNLHCHCGFQHGCSMANIQPASRSAPRRRRVPNTKTKSTTAVSSAVIDLDSDNEAPNAALTRTYEAGIQKQIDDVFKALESNDECLSDEEPRAKTCFVTPSEPKPKDFYTILSDSESEDGNRTLDHFNFKVSPYTCVSTSSGAVTNSTDNSLNIKPKKNVADPLSYVDHILNECDVLNVDRYNKPSSILSLDDLKRNANEILNDLSSYAEVLQPKEPEKKKPDAPAMEVCPPGGYAHQEVKRPTCPVCLENLGVSRQSVATLCGHIYCEQCLNNVMKTTKKCPICRVKLNKTKYHAIYL